MLHLLFSDVVNHYISPKNQAIYHDNNYVNHLCIMIHKKNDYIGYELTLHLVIRVINVFMISKSLMSFACHEGGFYSS